MKQASQFSLLKVRRFLPLFITQFFGAFNDNIFKNALIILITYRFATASDNAQILVALAAGVFLLPFFLFSATAGQLTDKYPKARLASIVKFVEIVIMVIATAGFYWQNQWLLLAVLFALGTQAAFFGPVKYALLPEQLAMGELVAGNGLIEAATFMAILLGTIIGGLLILGDHGLTIISAIILGVAIGGFIASLFIPSSRPGNPSLKINANIFSETVKLLRYTQQHRVIYIAIMGISWFWLFGAVFLSEFPVFVKHDLHAAEQVVTLFLTLFSIGLALGSLWCNILLKGKITAFYAPLGALAMTLFTADMYFATNQLSITSGTLISISQLLATFQGWRICVDLFCTSIAGGIYIIPLYVIMQQHSAASHRARVIASNNVLNALFMCLAMLATMLLLSIGLSVRQVFLSLAVANIGAALYITKLVPGLVIKGCLHILFRLFYRVKVVGLEHYRAAGERMVIVANHTSFLDPLLLAIFLPDGLTFVANTTIAQKWWVKFFLNVADTFVMDQTRPMAIKSLIDYTKSNKRCVIFPEGRLTLTGALMKVYEGPGMIADKAHAPLLPIRIQGAECTPFTRLKGKVRIHWFPKITLTIFPAVEIGISEEVKGRARRQKISFQLYEIMTHVMFASSQYRKTLFHALLDARFQHGAHQLIMEDMARIPVDYHTFITRCFVLGALIAKATRVGEAVGVLLPNTIPTVTTFFALQAFCRVPTMLNYSTGITNVLLACQMAQVTTVYSSEKFIRLGQLTELVEALAAAGIKVVYLEVLRDQVRIKDKIVAFFRAQWPRVAYQRINKANPHLVSADSRAVILFTSGSEGTPKGVVLSHANIQANRYQLMTCIDFNQTDKVFSALPVFHAFGLTGGLLLPLLCGIRVFFYPSPLHYRLVPELCYDTNATIFFGTDTFLAGYAKYAHPYDFYSIRYAFAGAEKLRDETRDLWSQKFGVRVFEGYGATETAPAISINTPLQNKMGTVGRFLPGIEYRINTIPGILDGGVLSVKGPNIMLGYLLASNPGLLVAPEGGWYDTGDVVDVDSQGFITIKGRVKRFAKIAGEMVSLPMVEQYLHHWWPEHQHAVISIPDSKRGEQLILLTTYPDASRESMITHGKAANMGDMAIPKKVVILKALLLLGTGKVDYPGLKSAYLASITASAD